MQTEGFNLDAGAGLSPAGNSECPRGPYIEPAPINAVMFEQLEFLLSHESGHCAPQCAECARLSRVQELLLRPFLRA